MIFKNTLSKAIIIYWIAILAIAGFFSIESFYDFFRGEEQFNYRIVLRSFTLAGISYLLVRLIIGVFKMTEYSISTLMIIFKFSYLTGLLGLVAIVMHFSNLARSADAYLFGGVCSFIALSGYLSSLWFKRKFSYDTAGRIARIYKFRLLESQ